MIDDFKRWKVDALRKYCQQRGFTLGNSKKKEELVALAYAAYSQNVPLVATKADEQLAAKQEYDKLLTLHDGTVIVDPLTIPDDEWLAEAAGLQRWPPCMIVDISEYLVARDERPLCTRLGNDYKEGLLFVLQCCKVYTVVAVAGIGPHHM